MAKCIYIAGPMSGVPHFNIPLFKMAAEDLRARGYEVVSPAELDSPKMQELALASEDGDMSKLREATGESWGDILARDVKVISDGGIQGIVFLPHWWKSRGARLEATVGLLNNLKFAEWARQEIGGIHTLSVKEVLFGIQQGFLGGAT